MACETSFCTIEKIPISRISSITFSSNGNVVALTRLLVSFLRKAFCVIFRLWDFSTDWDANRYFNCTSSALGSREACGVPFSCCKTNSNDIIANKVKS